MRRTGRRVAPWQIIRVLLLTCSSSGGASGMIVAAMNPLVRSQIRRATRVSGDAPGACRAGSDTVGLRRVVGHRTTVRAISGAQAGRAQRPSRARSTQTESPPWAGRSPRASCTSVGFGVRAAAGVTPRADNFVSSACSRPAKPLVSTPLPRPLLLSSGSWVRVLPGAQSGGLAGLTQIAEAGAGELRWLASPIAGSACVLDLLTACSARGE